MRLLDLVNKHESIPKGSLDCCNVVCYSTDIKTLRLHSDYESNIDQIHPICPFSIGAPRCIEFVPHGSNYTRVVRSVRTATRYTQCILVVSRCFNTGCCLAVLENNPTKSGTVYLSGNTNLN